MIRHRILACLTRRLFPGRMIWGLPYSLGGSKVKRNLGDVSSNANSVPKRPELAAPDYRDPVIEVYKKDVDRTLLRENLKLTVQERFEKFEHFMEYVNELREAGRKARREN